MDKITKLNINKKLNILQDRLLNYQIKYFNLELDLIVQNLQLNEISNKKNKIEFQSYIDSTNMKMEKLNISYNEIYTIYTSLESSKNKKSKG